MPIVEANRSVTGAVHTHLDVRVAAALDGVGGVLGPSCRRGHRRERLYRRAPGR
jgi:hypothetical protein